MSLNLDGHERLVSEAVKEFWGTRGDKGEGVRGGKTLDGFVDIFRWVVHNHGLPNATILSGKSAQVPGFFRPAKNWDILIVNGQTLIAAIELKSIAASFGKNCANRTEEALGSGIDIKEGFEEGAFEGLTRLFTGYLILVEDCNDTQSPVAITVNNFRVMKDFMHDPASRNTQYVRKPDGTFPRIQGVSYLNRFEILCRRLMQKNLYSAASVISAKRSDKDQGGYSYISKETSVKAFLAELASYTEKIAAIQE